MLDEKWLEAYPEVQGHIQDFIEASKDALPILKRYVAHIPNICDDLQDWIDDLRVQEIAVNGTNTLSAATGIVSTILLFTPLAVFGVGGLIGSGVAGGAIAIGDNIYNKVKGKKIQELVDENKEMMGKVENIMERFQALIKKVADVGKIHIADASTICIGLAGIAHTGAGLRAALNADKFTRLMCFFRMWRAGQLLPVGIATIRSITGVGSKLFGGLGAGVSVVTIVNGWVNGNPTRKSTIAMKKQLEESKGALEQLIDLLEGKGFTTGH